MESISLSCFTSGIAERRWPDDLGFDIALQDLPRCPESSAWTTGRRLRRAWQVNRCRLISAEPQPHRGKLDRCEEFVRDFIVSCGNAAEVLQPGEEPFDEVAFAVEPFSEARLPFPIGFGQDIRRRSLLFDPPTDAVGVIGFVRQRDGVRSEVVEQCARYLPSWAAVIASIIRPQTPAFRYRTKRL